MALLFLLGGEVGKQILNVSCVAASFDFQRKTLTIEEWSWLWEKIHGKGSPSTQFVLSRKWNNNIVNIIILCVWLPFSSKSSFKFSCLSKKLLACLFVTNFSLSFCGVGCVLKGLNYGVIYTLDG